MAHLKIVVGVLVLTVTVLLNTRPAEAANCVDDTSCVNGGTCPDNMAPCDCGSNGYSGDTCADECNENGDCGATGGTCDGTTKVCTCEDTAKKGRGCTSDCKVDGDCMNDGTCKLDAFPFKCVCGDYKGATCADACLVDGDCSNGGTCDTSGTNNLCSCGDFKGDHCADECNAAEDCDADGGTCTGTPKVCNCNDTTKKGPGCKTNKSGASAVTGLSLMSLLVVLTGHIL